MVVKTWPICGQTKQGSLRQGRGTGALWLLILLFQLLLPGTQLQAEEAVRFEWDPNTEQDLQGYNLYRSVTSGSGYVRVNNQLILTSSGKDTPPALGTTYYYVVTAVNTSNLESAYSNQVEFFYAPVNVPPEAAPDVVTMQEDSTITIDVLANDSDPDGDELTISDLSQPAFGMASLLSDNTIVYTPHPNFNGVDSFSYTLDDGNQGEATATVTVTVLPVNDLPQAGDDTATTQEDESVTINVLANDSDPDGDELTVSGLSQPDSGVAALMSDNTIEYTPNPDFNGVDSFSYTLDDGNNGQAVATVTVTVLPVNDPPQAGDDTTTTPEDEPVTIDVLANDSDPDGDEFTISDLSQPDSGTASLMSDNTIEYTPHPDFNGVDSFSYTLDDGNNGQAVATVTVTVLSVNDLPQAGDDTATTQEDEPVTINVLANDSDPGGDELTISGLSQPDSGVAALMTDNTIEYTPHPDFNGVDSFSYTLDDGNNGHSVATVTVTVLSVNDLPQAGDDTATTQEDESVTINVLANDSDPDGDELTISDLSHPDSGTVSLTSDNMIVYTPNPDFNGVDSFSYTLDDGNNGHSVATVTVTVLSVNDLPQAGDDTATTPEDEPVTINVLANDSDPGGEELTVSGLSQPDSGTALLMTDNTIEYTPNPDFNGVDSFSYTLDNGQQGQAVATVTVTVLPVNDLPQAGADSATTQEDEPVIINVLANDSDPDGDELTVSGLSQPDSGTASLLSDNTIEYTPNPDFNGVDFFSYTLDDGNQGEVATTVTVTVLPVNDLPQAGDDTATTPEDEPVTINVLANDSDPGGDELSISGHSQPDYGIAVLLSDNTIEYTPNPDFNGVDSFSYTLDDGQQGQAVATVTVTVLPVNDLPQAGADTATIRVDEPVTIDVLANDSDPDGDELTVSGLSQPDHGIAKLTQDNTIEYTPNPGFNGVDSFSYTLDDGQQGQAVATVTVTVLPVSAFPKAGDDTAITQEDEPVTIDVLANDSDPDGDDLTITGLSQPDHGIAKLTQDNTIEYTPNPDFNGVDSFSYTVGNSRGAETDATVRITVKPVNDPPLVDAGEDWVARGGEITSLLGFASDPDNFELSYSWSQLAGPAVELFESHQPEATFTAPRLNNDTHLIFRLKVNDGQEISEARVRIVILKADPLYFPVQLPHDLMHGESTFVGVAVLNPSLQASEVIAARFDTFGNRTELPGSVLAPRTQSSLLASEIAIEPDSSILAFEGRQEVVEGYFTVGDTQLGRLDGVKAALQPSRELYFPVARSRIDEEISLFLVNPNAGETSQLKLSLVDRDGTLLEESIETLPGSGSLVSRWDDLFDSVALEEGYILVEGDLPLKGFQISATEQNLTAYVAQAPRQKARIFVPHFSVAPSGTSQIRLINTGDSRVTVKLLAWDGRSHLVGITQLTIEPYELFLGDPVDLLKLESGEKASYFLELVLSDQKSEAASVIGAVTFETENGRSSTALSMPDEGATDQIIAHVVESPQHQVVTRLVILNTHTEAIEVEITAFDPEGAPNGSTVLELPPRSKLVDVLTSERLLGSAFHQVGGHLRLTGSLPFHTFALLGDYDGEFLTTVEGQQAPPDPTPSRPTSRRTSR